MIRRFAIAAALCLVGAGAVAQVYNPPTPASIGAMTTSGSNATDPVSLSGGLVVGGALRSTFNGSAALPASQATAGFAITSNYAGAGEVDFWSLVNNENVNGEGFYFYQKTGAGTTKLLADIFSASTNTELDFNSPAGKYFSFLVNDSTGFASFSSNAPNGLTFGSDLSGGAYITLNATAATIDNKPLVATLGIVGVTTNSNAAAGNVGEYLTGQTNTVSLTSTTSKTITSVSLTAGDWDVEGTLQFNPAGGTIIADAKAGVSAVDNTLPTAMTAGGYVSIDATAAAGVGHTLQTGAQRVSIASTTTIYLVAQATFSVSTMTGSGFIRARRVR